MEASSKPVAWLVRTSGPLAGTRHVVPAGGVVIGRDSNCDIVLDGEEAVTVSSRHAEIRLGAGSYRIRDLDSTNGTYVNGQRVTECELQPPATVRLGSSGPELRLELIEALGAGLEKTLVAIPTIEPPPSVLELKDAEDSAHEELLSEAVRKARQARQSGAGGQTMTIMRAVMGTAIHRSGRRLRWVIAVLATALVAVSGFSVWRIYELRHEKSDIDRQILSIETKLEKGGLKSEALDQLIGKLDTYEQKARQLQDSMFYKLGVKGQEQAFIEREIGVLMKEFGAEEYSIPPEFVEQVKRYVERYQTSDRADVERALGHSGADLETMRQIFERQNLPPDLVYMALVESAFIAQSTSSKGAAGVWQFTPATARAYGMKVNGEVDERYDLVKSTEAAARYVRDLILDFGAGSSVMLAMAAYNGGPGRVKRAVRRVRDPIRQRNFWYLYRVRALPAETRQYVPKIIAAIIVGRNLERFGF